MKNRYIGKNILDLLSTIEYAQKQDIKAMVISYNFEKAFDHVEWNIL